MRRSRQTAKGVPTFRSYTKWIDAVRATFGAERDAVLQRYRLIKAGEKNKIWRKGSYRSFAEVVEREFGIPAQKWEHMCAVVQHFGEGAIADWGYEISVVLLRAAKEGKAIERAVLAELDEMAKIRGNRLPSVEAVRMMVSKYVKPVAPTTTGTSMVARLRAEVKAKDELIAELQRELKNRDRQISQLKSRLAGKRRAAA